MSITIKEVVTSIDVTGGTDLIFKKIGGGGLNKVVFALAAGMSLLNRSKLTIRTKDAVADTSQPSSYSKAGVTLTLGVPFTLANGETDFDSVEISLRRGIETTDTQHLEVRQIGRAHV